MRTIGALSELTDTISGFKRNSQSIGFVPTMGALHDGHLALIKKSNEQNDVTIVSIFVNPLQFNNPSDLEKYPRVIEEDTELLKKQNVDVVFMPDEKALYPEKPKVSINFGPMAERLEGKYRKGHFEGVGVIVSKLLHLVDPTRAYFGLKDLQQFILIRRMCQDLNFPCEIVGVDTIREKSGLALSSRNRRLSSEGLKIATVMSQGLNEIREGVANGQPLSQLLHSCKEMYHEKKGLDLEYLEAVDPHDLSPVDNYSSLSELAVCVAGYVEGVRLIDNLYLRLK
ncbi:pantoate--beta-alanine ligase [Ekhidna sp.]|uniref:pantoate--beta-alanine ligase n=1 Tax=Ekhidna sp. TaxID=2608089 RepID=UPI003C7C2E02